jgi:calcineurin-like phosphoesterase family protein
LSSEYWSKGALNSILEAALLHIGPYEVLAKHMPATMKLEIPDFCDFMICGHIHEKWKHTFLDDIPIINVGVDVWNYTPIPITIIENIIKSHNSIIRDSRIVK